MTPGQIRQRVRELGGNPVIYFGPVRPDGTRPFVEGGIVNSAEYAGILAAWHRHNNGPESDEERRARNRAWAAADRSD